MSGRTVSVFSAGQYTVAATETIFVKPGPWGLQLRYQDTTPSTAVFTADPATDLLTVADHGAYLGLKCKFTTDGVLGELPAPLNASDTYYVIPVSANTFKVATSYANALRGTAVNITSEGVADVNWVPTNAATRTLQVSVSVDGVNFVNAFQLDGASAVTLAALSISGSAADKVYQFSGVSSITAVKIALANADGQVAVSGKLISRA